MHDLEATVAALIAPGKGILAAEETVGTISKRFESLGIVSWGGKTACFEQGQQALYHRARCNSAASLGQYKEVVERVAQTMVKQAEVVGA